MNFLNHFSSGEALVPRNHKTDKGGAHIFVELLTYFKETMSIDDYMSLFYMHSLCEKTISYWRNKDYNSGNITYSQVCNINRTNFPDQVKEGVETIFMACSGYKQYADRNYDSAVDKINTAIAHTFKQKEKMPEFAKALYEHNLNLIRIYIRTKDQDRIVSYFSRLLASLFFNVQHPISHSNELMALTEEQRETWVHYVLNNTVFALQRTFKDDESTAETIMKKTFETTFNSATGEYSFLKPIQQSLRIILAYINGDDNGYQDLVCNQFEVIRESPNFVKKQIIVNHLKWAEIHGETLSDHSNYNYFAEIAAKFGINLRPDVVSLKVAV